MRPVLPACEPQPLFDRQRTREIEQRASSGLPPHTLMRRAGAAVARLALALEPHAQQIWVAAGPGNNGGDGLEAAFHLQRAGKQVAVTLAARPEALPEDARDAWARALSVGVSVQAPDVTQGMACDLAIDALLGIGGGRAPQGSLAGLVERLNAFEPRTVLAVDVPSGLDADTGQAWGDSATAVRAAHTLALLTLKPGLHTAAGRDHAGRVWFDDLGIDADPAVRLAWLTGSSAVEQAMPQRRHAQHKGSFGDLWVVGGAPGMSGAALLAARAGQAAGAGRVYVQLLDGSAPAFDPLRPELMFRPAAAMSPTTATVVCGCGGGDAVRDPLAALLGRAPRLVLDADALNTMATDTSLQALLRHRATRGQATLLTPHPLEAAHLLGCSTAQVQADRIGMALRLARHLACAVVLKGSGTVIASAGGIVHINPTGNASLATAGTGDVLAGWIGGLWAQWPDAGVADTRTEYGLRSAIAASYVHGAVADRHAHGALRASDLIEAMQRWSPFSIPAKVAAA